MEIISNYHTHTYLCKHAVGDVEDYVLAAINKGLKEIGISDHGPVPYPNYYRRMSVDDLWNVYYPNLLNCKAIYGDQISIKSGLEIEYDEDYEGYYKGLLTKFDYLVLGQHFFKGKFNKEKLDVYNEIYPEDIKYYCISVIKAMRSGLFKFVAHPDIIFFSIENFDDICEFCSKLLIDEAVKLNIPLEFNANGLRRRKAKDSKGNEYIQYPRDEFWKIVSESKAKVIISDDAHDPINIKDKFTELAYDLAINKYKLNVIDKLDF